MSKLQLGESIKQARKGKGLTQKQLAKKLSIGESTVRMWELGKNTPSIKTIKEISKALNLSSTSLLESAGYLDLSHVKNFMGKITEEKKAAAPEKVDLSEVIEYARLGVDFYYGDDKLTDEQKESFTQIMNGLLVLLTSNLATPGEMEEVISAYYDKMGGN